MAQNRNAIGAIFHCTECEKEFQDYTKALKQAAAHSKKTGHTVTGEVTYYITFDNKEKFKGYAQ